MKRLKNLEAYLTYQKNKLKNIYTGGNLTLGDIIVDENYFCLNWALSDDIMQLGWNTVGVFEETDKGLKFIRLDKLNRDNDEKTCVFISNGTKLVKIETEQVYTQVVTRAVASCTFAHLVFGKTHVIAHLDNGYLEQGFDTIKTIIGGAGSVSGFCSYIALNEKGRKEMDFAYNLSSLCGSGFSSICRNNGLDMLGHMEIGLSLEADGLQLFGDISLIGNLKDDQETPSICFASQQELMAIDLNELTNRGTSSGGSCVIL